MGTDNNKSRILLVVFLTTFCFSACQELMMNEAQSLRITNPIIAVDSSGAMWISNDSAKYLYRLHWDVDIDDIAEPYLSLDTIEYYKVKPEFKNKKYAVAFHENTFTPFFHHEIDFEKYNLFYAVVLLSKLKFSDVLETPAIFRIYLHELFARTYIDELPDVIKTRHGIQSTPYFIQQNRTEKVFLIPDCYWVSEDAIDFKPICMEIPVDSLEDAGFEIYGYPVYKKQSLDFDEYCLQLTKSDEFPVIYEGKIVPWRAAQEP